MESKKFEMPSPEETGRIQNERTLSDAELIQGGAGYYVVDEKGIRLRVTPEQIEQAKAEMKRENEESPIIELPQDPIRVEKLREKLEIHFSQQEKSSEREKKIDLKLEWIDQRITEYLLLLVNVVEFYNKEEINKTGDLLKIALRTAFFYDFYAETKDRDYLDEADKYKTLLYSQVSVQDKVDLQKIENQIMELFKYEEQIGEKIKAGFALSEDEIMKHWQMKSADALFYGRIINIFTIGKNLIPVIYGYTQILDMLLDIREYEQDFKKQELNMLYMRLLQANPKNRIPTSKSEATELAKNSGVSNDIKREIDNIISQLRKHELKDDFMSSAITVKQKEIEAELRLPA